MLRIGWMLLLVSATIAQGQDQLERLHLKYAVESERLHKPIVTLRANYKARLRQLEEQFMNDGDLARALAAKAAAEAVGTNSEPEQEGQRIPEIAEARRIYEREHAKRLKQEIDALNKLQSAYREQLIKLRASLTKARKIEEAKAVDAALKKLGDPTSSAAAIPGACVLHFSFDEKTKDGKIVDDSGSGHDGSAADSAWLSKGYRGGGHRLVSAGDRIKIEHDAVFVGEAATLACWVKLNSAPGYDSRVWDKYDHESKRGYQFGITKGRASIQYCTKAGHRRLDSDQTLALGKWWHIVYAYDKSSLAIYVDGKLVGSKSDDPIVHLNNPIRMGKDLYGGHMPDASIDSVQFFKRRLNEREIERVYHAELGGAK